MHIAFTAMGCSQEEQCGGISRSAASNPKVLNQVKIEFRHCAFAEPSPSEYTDAYWKFLSVMSQDKIAVAIKGDNCILNYGFRLFKKNEKIVSQHQYIRQKLRTWQAFIGS